MKSLFVMDPLESIQISGDSTYMMMLESTRRGHDVYMCVPNQLYVLEGRARGRIISVKTTSSPPYFHTGEVNDTDLSTFDVVWMRKDPPYDMNYVFTTWLLDMITDCTVVVNDPVGLKLFNEKLWAMRWPQFHPKTLLTCDMEELRQFIANQPGKVVLKPWDGNGGRGVLVTDAGDKNLSSMLELLTAEGDQYVIAQEYVKDIIYGDKRILLIEGQPVGAILRVPPVTDHRGNMHVGASVEACELSDKEQEICAALEPELNRHGQVFVGIDVIGGRLTEINVTSPTGIQEANRLYDVHLERTLLDAVEARVGRLARESL